MHNPRTPKFMEAVRSSCGDLRRVNSSFCFPAHRREGFFEDNIRATGADPLGSLGDLGWCACVLVQQQLQLHAAASVEFAVRSQQL
jgi:hypothetical protein